MVPSVDDFLLIDEQLQTHSLYRCYNNNNGAVALSNLLQEEAFLCEGKAFVLFYCCCCYMSNFGDEFLLRKITHTIMIWRTICIKSWLEGWWGRNIKVGKFYNKCTWDSSFNWNKTVWWNLKHKRSSCTLSSPRAIKTIIILNWNRTQKSTTTTTFSGRMHFPPLSAYYLMKGGKSAALPERIFMINSRLQNRWTRGCRKIRKLICVKPQMRIIAVVVVMLNVRLIGLKVSEDDALCGIDVRYLFP